MMMKQTLEKTARLARLKFSEKELALFVTKAKHVLDYVEQLKGLDTESIEPTSHAIEIVNAFREDTPQKFPGGEKILGIAPSHCQNLFEVPKVIDET